MNVQRANRLFWMHGKLCVQMHARWYMMTARMVLFFLFLQTTRNSILVHATSKIHYHLFSQYITVCEECCCLSSFSKWIRQRCWFFYFHSIFLPNNITTCVYFVKIQTLNENYMFVVSIRVNVECDRHFINSMLNCESIVSSEFLKEKLNSFTVN